MTGGRRSSWCRPRTAARRASSPRATTTTPIPRGRPTGARSCSRRPATTTATTTTPPTSGSWPPRAARPGRLTATAGPAGHPVFSPAGDTIAYLGRSRDQRVRRQHPALRDPGDGRRAPLSHRRLRPLLLAARRPTDLESRRQRHHRRRGGPGQPRRLPGAGGGGPGHADRRGRAGRRRLLRLRDGADHRLRGERARLPGRGLRLRRGRRRREADHRPQPGLEARGRAEPPGALPLRAGRHDGGRLDHEAVRLRGREARIPCSSTCTAAPTPSTATRSSTSSRSRRARATRCSTPTRAAARATAKRSPARWWATGAAATRRTCRPASTRRSDATTGSIPRGWACWAAATAGS